MKTVNVEVWSDFVCPWCWIAKRRLEKAIAGLAGKVEVSVTTNSYRLARGMAPIDYTRALHQKFGNPAAANGMMAAVGENGLSEGLAYNFETMRFGDTSDAHVMIKSIASSALADRLIERIYKAATTDGIDIFDRKALMTLAKETGVTDLDFDFDSQSVAYEIVSDEARANSIANGVPLFLFNDKLYISGAQPVAVFEKALMDAAVEKPEASGFADGAVCSADGCSR
ncbi:disulfide bond formation protein DsbA [Rhizobium anhuiense]|uniref:DsbA family oxidoreductase n=1 Tax=Rhizobium anhuiense TaxID=1184720 RepID=UPI000BE7B3DA|nr:DsbA family oxidoreductase [Rhizobium anhuiense]PDS59932.1 disulfide bond formation protein DsbA [Rhizobium anhuiense]